VINVFYRFNAKRFCDAIGKRYAAITVAGIRRIDEFLPIPRHDGQVYIRLLPTCSEMLLNGFEKFAAVDRVSRFIYFFIIRLLLFIP
jgi:hypothetical protein